MARRPFKPDDRVFVFGNMVAAPTGFGVVVDVEPEKQRVHVRLLDGQVYIYMRDTVTHASVVAEFLQAARVEGKN